MRVAHLPWACQEILSWEEFLVSVMVFPCLQTALPPSMLCQSSALYCHSLSVVCCCRNTGIFACLAVKQQQRVWGTEPSWRRKPACMWAALTVCLECSEVNGHAVIAGLPRL